MNCLILQGSPRPQGNTASLTAVFADEFVLRGGNCREIRLFEKEIHPCTACRSCQQDWSAFGCVCHDSMDEIAPLVLACDLLVLASPIHSWYCTAPMKAALDRMVYGFNKYYDARRGPSLWKGKRVALIATCGYPPDRGADLWEQGVRRYCRHSGLRYEGLLVERHLSYDRPFFDPEKEAHARAFAAKLFSDG